MEGIINQYSIERALVLAINAGADLICVGNNINTGFEPDRPFRLVDIIVAAVKRGEIPYARLLQSHNRIERLLKKLNSLQPKY
jgi:beta-N-acetylhexosaminidase